MADFNILFQGQNPGAATANAFLGGMQLRQTQDQRAQLMQQRQQQLDLERQKAEAEQRATQLKQTRDNLTTTLQLLGTATDEASYQRNRQTAVQLGLDVSQIPPNFDPNWVKQSAAQAQALLGKVDQELTGNIKDFRFARSPEGGGFTGSFTNFQQYIHPPSALTIPYNSTVSTGGGTGEVTATGPNGQKIRLNPQTGQWEPMGGAGGNASGGFPSGGQ